MKKKKSVAWTQVSSQTTSYVIDLISWILILASSMTMISQVFLELKIEDKYAFIMLILLAIIIALYRVSFSCLFLPVITTAISVFIYVNNSVKVEDAFLFPLSVYLKKYARHFAQTVYIEPGKEEYLGLALIAAGVIVVVVFETLSRLTGRKIFRFVLPLAILIAEAYVGVLPKWNGIALLLVAIVFYKSNQDIVGMIAIVSVVVMVPFIFTLPAKELAKKAPDVLEFQRNMEKTVKAELFNPYFTQDDSTIDNEAPEIYDQEMLVFESDKPIKSNHYLAEYQGDIYSNGKWNQSNQFEKQCKKAGLDPDKMRECLSKGPYIMANSLKKAVDDYYEDLSYWRSVESDQIKADYHKLPETVDAKINFTGLKNNAALIPYASDYTKLEDVNIQGDTISRKSRLVRSVDVTCLAAVDGSKSQMWGVKVDSPYGKSYTYNELQEEVLFEYYVDLELKQLNEDACKEVRGENWKYWDWYNKFARKEYTKIPDECREYVDRYISSMSEYITGYSGDINQCIEEDINEKDRVDGALLIKTLITARCNYSWTLSKVPDNTDVIDYFLNYSHRGYCKHFAAATTLMCRRFGIPARYVTGYVVKQRNSDIKKDGTVSISVTDRNAHAWTEIYLDNVGWVPLETTPGFESDSKVLPSDKSIADKRKQSEMEELKQSSDKNKVREEYNKEHKDSENSQIEENTQQASPKDSQKDSQQDSQKDSQQANQKDSQTASGDKQGAGSGEGSGTGSKSKEGKNGLSAWMITVINVAALLLISLGLILLLKHNNKMQKNGIADRLAKQRYNAVVKSINRKLYKSMKRHHKVPFHQITDAEYEKALIKAYPDISQEDWKQFIVIVQKVAFSQENITEEEAEFCYRLYNIRNGKPD